MASSSFSFFVLMLLQVLLSLLLLSRSAYASTYNERGDAPDATSNAIPLPAGTNIVLGKLRSGADTDCYLYCSPQRQTTVTIIGKARSSRTHVDLQLSLRYKSGKKLVSDNFINGPPYRLFDDDSRSSPFIPTLQCPASIRNDLKFEDTCIRASLRFSGYAVCVHNAGYFFQDDGFLNDGTLIPNDDPTMATDLYKIIFDPPSSANCVGTPPPTSKPVAQPPTPPPTAQPTSAKPTSSPSLRPTRAPSGFYLVNTSNGADVRPLFSTATISKSQIPNFTIRFDPDSVNIGGVSKITFKVDGAVSSDETLTAPYSLYGDSNTLPATRYNPWTNYKLDTVQTISAELFYSPPANSRKTYSLKVRVVA